MVTPIVIGVFGTANNFPLSKGLVQGLEDLSGDHPKYSIFKIS